MVAQDWSISGLAVELEVDRRTVAKRVKDLKPARSEGKIDYYRMADVVRAIYEGENASGSLEAEKTRLTKAQADHEELKVAQLKATLIPSELVISTWQTLVVSAKAKLLALPTKTAHAVLAANEIIEIEAILKQQVYEALAELAVDGLPTDISKRLAESGGSVESAAETDGQPVGGHQSEVKQRKQRRSGNVAD